MSKEITLKYYSDPGHAWVAVKIKKVVDLGLTESISKYSYVRGKTLYAEYHSDAGKIVDALKSAGYTVNFDYKHTDKQSPIRSYDSATQKNILISVILA